MACLGTDIAESRLIINLLAAELTQNVDGPGIQAHNRAAARALDSSSSEASPLNSVPVADEFSF